MPPEPTSPSCNYPNFFSSTFAPAIEKRLPQERTLPARALDHLTNVGPFLRTVSDELCTEGRMGEGSGRNTLSFIARSATTAAVTTGTIGLTALGLTFGSPLLALGAGAVGLAILPPLAERAITNFADFAQGFLQDIRSGLTRKDA